MSDLSRCEESPCEEANEALSESGKRIDAEKARLRRSMLALLSRVDDRRALEAGESVAERVVAWSGWHTADSVVLYSTLPGEVDTKPLIQAARNAGKRLLFPRMIAGRTLEFAHVERLGSLRPGRFGVLEPDAQRPADRMLDDALILVPGCAFDHRGGRLGRGAGYYDRTIQRLRADSSRSKIVGVGFAIQIVDAVPVAAFDERMDGVVTEAALIWNE